MKTKFTLIPAVAIAAVTFSTGTASAREDNAMVGYAHTIEDIAEELEDEFRIHYKHSGAYRHLMSDVNKILGEAEHIDELAHARYPSLRHMRADLEDLDNLAHHLHRVVDAVEDGRYSGHVDGCTKHVHTMLASLTNMIHKMERYVEYLARPSGGGCEHERRSVSYGYGSGNGVVLRASFGRH